MFSIVEPQKVEAIEVLCIKGRPLIYVVSWSCQTTKHLSLLIVLFKVREHGLNRKLRCS